MGFTVENLDWVGPTCHCWVASPSVKPVQNLSEERKGTTVYVFTETTVANGEKWDKR